MDILFSGTPECPDYVPLPSVWLDVARAGVLPAAIVFMMAVAVPPERLPVSTDPVVMMSPSGEPPHTHQETNEPMPPASHFDEVGSTGGGSDVPFIQSYDAANDIAIRNAYDRRRRQAWLASMTWTSSPIWMSSTTPSSTSLP